MPKKRHWGHHQRGPGRLEPRRAAEQGFAGRLAACHQWVENLQWQRTCLSSAKVRICTNGYTCGSNSQLDIDLRVSSLSAAVQTDGGGLGGRSTVFFLTGQSIAVSQGTPQPACRSQLSPIYALLTLAPRACADCCCVHLLPRHGDATGSDAISARWLAAQRLAQRTVGGATDRRRRDWWRQDGSRTAAQRKWRLDRWRRCPHCCGCRHHGPRHRYRVPLPPPFARAVAAPSSPRSAPLLTPRWAAGTKVPRCATVTGKAGAGVLGQPRVPEISKNTTPNVSKIDHIIGSQNKQDYYTDFDVRSIFSPRTVRTSALRSPLGFLSENVSILPIGGQIPPGPSMCG